MANDEKAVSPVIGVMLMVVVTVILAAVVSSFASDVGTTEKAPVMSLSCEITQGQGEMADGITIRHVSGDSVPTRDLKIITVFENNVTETLPNVNTTYWGSYVVPWTYNQSGSGITNFGNYTLRAGVPMRASSWDTIIWGGIELNGNDTGKDDVHWMIQKWDELEPDDTVTVKVLHVPSGKMIYQADVIVGGVNR